MMSFAHFYQLIVHSRLIHWLEILPGQLSNFNKNTFHSSFKKYFKTLEAIPTIVPQYLDLENSITALTNSQRLSNDSCWQIAKIEKMLRQFIPWRKGPFYLYGIHIDSSWRSDWKWQRVLTHISSLSERLVLDIGCGNGYYLWRMLGAGAKLAVGIDPQPLFLFQFEAIRKLLGNEQRANLLPLTSEQLPPLKAFDTVFSMGVLYHLKSPIDHLLQVKKQLIYGGELVLETLIINGNENQVLMPKQNYAKMRNVWFIPSAKALNIWLTRCGFKEIILVNTTRTTNKEQHGTSWANSVSLSECLDTLDHSKTIEGYPAPVRAIIIAKNK
ncbi:MAG: tRNA 5-methoxyuridine(34)/uridine 5-oxyacetic acid(34) synthase CmoB [Candidatus Dasytiphilus stammeri]